MLCFITHIALVVHFLLLYWVELKHLSLITRSLVFNRSLQHSTIRQCSLIVLICSSTCSSFTSWAAIRAISNISLLLIVSRVLELLTFFGC